MPDNDDITRFRKQLLDRQQELQALLVTSDDAAKTVELDQSCVGRLSRMDAMQGQAMSVETGRRRQLELQKISSALHRLDSGDYGYCLRCEEAIDVKRLALDPAVTLCIRCASESEKK